MSSLTQALSNVQEQPEQSDAQTYLDKLVGEGKKYSDVEQLAKAYVNADMHLNELRDKLDDQTGNEKLLREVIDMLQANNGTDPSASTPDNSAAGGSENIQDIEKLVDQKVKEQQTQQQAEANVRTSLAKMAEVYGSEYSGKQAFIKTVNGDNRIQSILDDLAATNPDAFIRFLTGTVPPEEKSGTNTPGTQDRGSADQKVPAGSGFTAEYVRKVRKEDPKLYKSAEFQAKLESAVAEYMDKGKDFFAT